jgi:hypothetical protein
MVRRLILTGLIATACAAVGSSVALARSAGPTYTYNASGVETGVPTDNTSPFAGAAVGTRGLALWNASVVHDPLDSCGSTAIQPGGSFTLSGTGGVHLAGSFTGGAVVAPAGFCGGGATPPCTNESFAIDAFLTLNGTLSGEFKGTLTHFSTILGGSCVTYFATISGRLTAG